MIPETIGWAACGGALMGASASALLAATGSTRGVSGMAAAALGEDRLLGVSYLLGMAVAGACLYVLEPAAFGGGGRPLLVMLVAGLLVGFGARLANGCTSGHGVLGVARGSKRSIVAVSLFVATAMLVVWAWPPKGAGQ